MKQLTVILHKSHRKNEFSCGVELLDNYLKRQANQDLKRKLSVCYVMEDQNTRQIKGYYTLSSNSISSDFIPDNLKKKLPSAYTDIPVTLLGRLAVDRNFQGKRLGRVLLIDALRRSYDISHRLGSFAVVVDPFDSGAERFYEKYGFIHLPDSGKMFLPMKTIRGLFD